MTADLKLLPCPFCGGEASFGTATIQRQKNDRGDYGIFTGHFVNCIICGADNQGITEGHRTQEAAAAKWNRRTCENEPSRAPNDEAGNGIGRGVPSAPADGSSDIHSQESP